jgi:hypothetical protein
MVFFLIRILSKVSDPTGSGSTTLPDSPTVPVMEVSCAFCASLKKKIFLVNLNGSDPELFLKELIQKPKL